MFSISAIAVSRPRKYDSVVMEQRRFTVLHPPHELTFDSVKLMSAETTIGYFGASSADGAPTSTTLHALQGM